MAKNKSKKILSKLKNTKHISITPPPNYESLKPAFSFRDINYRGKVCLSQCDIKGKADVADKLLQISQFTWSQIHSKPKENYGYEKIPFKRFKVTLPSTVTEDTTLLVFRFSCAGRMAGYRKEDVFHIVAISPNHQLY